MLNAICPIMPSRDFTATEAFYARLGFRTGLRLEKEYLITGRDGLEVHFFHAPEHRPQDSDHGAYLRTEEVDGLSDAWRDLGLPSDEGFPRLQPAETKSWGMREVTVWDPDGNLLRIGQEA